MGSSRLLDAMATWVSDTRKGKEAKLKVLENLIVANDNGLTGRDLGHCDKKICRSKISEETLTKAVGIELGVDR